MTSTVYVTHVVLHYSESGQTRLFLLGFFPSDRQATGSVNGMSLPLPSSTRPGKETNVPSDFQTSIHKHVDENLEPNIWLKRK